MPKNNRQKNKKVRRRRSPIKIFFRIIFSILLIFLLFASAFVFAYNKISKEVITNQQDNDKNESEQVEESNSKKGIKLNIAVLGVDKDETRTDVMFVVHFDSKEGRFSLLSIPRDTKVDVSASVKKIYNSNDRYYQSPTKINSIHAYGGEKGPECAVLQLENLLGIDIDNYVKVNIEGFGAIIDAIGGVEFDVPQDMRWDMRDTGDILINLKKGPQVLDGNKAIQLVRFRRYAEGDVARVKVQQDFLKTAANKILSTDTIIKNINDYIKIFFKYVKTDISLVDAIKYVGYIKDINISNATFETLPGEGQYIDGVSYYINDKTETKKVVDELFYGKVVEDEPKNNEPISSKGKNIEVSNGGYVNGLAGNFKQKLSADGFTINAVTTYNGERQKYTRIIVPSENMGDDLKKYFDDARVEVNKSLITEGNDILIIIGTEQK